MLDLRENAITDKGLQMLCSALAVGKVKSLVEVQLSGGTLTGAVSARLVPVIKMRRPDLVFTIEGEYGRATCVRTPSVETEVDQQAPEQDKTNTPAPEVADVGPTKVSVGRTSSSARAAPSIIFDSDGGCACWLLPLGNAANPSPPTGMRK